MQSNMAVTVRICAGRVCVETEADVYVHVVLTAAPVTFKVLVKVGKVEVRVVSRVDVKVIAGVVGIEVTVTVSLKGGKAQSRSYY